MTLLAKFIRCDTHEILLETEVKPIRASDIKCEFDGLDTIFDIKIETYILEEQRRTNLWINSE